MANSEGSPRNGMNIYKVENFPWDRRGGGIIRYST